MHSDGQTSDCVGAREVSDGLAKLEDSNTPSLQSRGILGESGPLFQHRRHCSNTAHRMRLSTRDFVLACSMHIFVVEPAMKIETRFDEATSTLTYVVYDEATRDAVIIDPVLDFDPLAWQTDTQSASALIAWIREHNLRVHYVMETHAHADHLSAAQFLKQELQAPVVIGEHIRTVQATFKGLFNLPETFATDGSQFDRLMADGEVLKAGSLEIRVLHTPGHTPACVSYLIDDAVFTGDALFMDDYGTGRCDFPRGSSEALYRSVTEKLYALPDDTRVFVGHDYQPGGRPVRWETTIGASKDHNPQLDATTTQAQFVAFRNERDAGLAPPRLIFQSVQVNADGGRLPAAEENGRRYLKIPLNLFKKSENPADQ